MAITTRAELQDAIGNWLKNSAEYGSAGSAVARTNEWISEAEDRLHATLRVREMEAYADIVLRLSIAAGSAGGTANALTLTLTPSPALAAYALGNTYSFTATATNTGPVEVAVSGQAATNIRKGDNSVPLEINDIVNTHVYHIYYDGNQFRLVPPGGVPLPSRYLGARRSYLDQAGTLSRIEIVSSDLFWSIRASTTTGSPDMATVESEYLIFGPRPDGAYSARLLYWRAFPALSGTGDDLRLLTKYRDIYLHGAMIAAWTFLDNDAQITRYAALWDDAVRRVERSDKRDRHPGPLRARPDFAAV